jgi:hypothetical protein
MIRRFAAVAAAVLCAAGMCGCGNPVKGKVEKSVARSLPEIIGPADSYSVQAYGPTMRIMRGRLDGLDITGINVRLPNGIAVSRLDVAIHDIEFNTDTREIEKAGETRYAATLAERELTRYLAAKHPGIPQLAATLRNGQITVLAKPGVSVLKVAVQGSADLVVRDQRILALDLKKLRVAGIGVPGFAREFIEGQLGTIFDARDLGFEATIQSAVIGPDVLTLNGGLDLMKVIEQRKKTLQAQPAQKGTS